MRMMKLEKKKKNFFDIVDIGPIFTKKQTRQISASCEPEHTNKFDEELVKRDMRLYHSSTWCIITKPDMYLCTIPLRYSKGLGAVPPCGKKL